MDNKTTYKPCSWGGKCVQKTDPANPQVGLIFNKQIILASFEKQSLILPQSALPRDYYVISLGLICRQEWKLDKISPVPVRLRLGSLDYVNYLEQKPNTSMRW